jgi:alpha-L-rhamnosidase
MSIQAFSLRTNSIRQAFGIDTPRPEFAWKLTGPVSSILQTAYYVQASQSSKFEAGDLTWDTGKIQGDDQFGIVYGGTPLKGMTRYYWRVRVWARGKDSTNGSKQHESD